jgi:4-amino-4-deoxy-L-arabinose transferase-like glycosyltransferase
MLQRNRTTNSPVLPGSSSRQELRLLAKDVRVTEEVVPRRKFMRRGNTMFHWIGALLAMVALLLPPAKIVGAMLPAAYANYRVELARGLWLMKGALLVNALLVIIWPHVRKRWFSDETSTGVVVERFWSWPKSECWILAGLAALAVVPRAYQLSSGYSFDEITISSSMAERPLPQLLMRSEPWRVVNALCAFALYRVFGVSEICGRLVSFLSGVAAVPLVYVLARRWGSPREATGAAIVLALSTFHVWYSQIMTSYALAFFLLIGSMILLERCLDRDRASDWLCWGAAVFLSLVVNFQLTVFVLIAMIGRAVFPKAPACWEPNWHHGKRVGWLAAYACSFSLTLFSPNFFIWSGVVSGLTGSSDAHFINNEPRGTIFGQTAIFTDWLANGYCPTSLQVPLVVFALLGAILWARRRPALLLYLICPTFVFWTLFYLGVIRRVTPRHSIFTLVPLCIFVGSGVAWGLCLARRLRHPTIRLITSVAAAGVVLLGLAGAITSLVSYDSKERFPLQPAAAFVTQHAPPGTRVYIGGFGWYGLQYYLPSVAELRNDNAFERALASPDAFILIYFDNGLQNYLGSLAEPLRAQMLGRAQLLFAYHGRKEQYLDMSDVYVYKIGRGI